MEWFVFIWILVALYQRINVTANQLFTSASEEASAHQDENEDRRLLIESFQKAADGVIPWYSNYLSASAIPMENGTTNQ